MVRFLVGFTTVTLLLSSVEHGRADYVSAVLSADPSAGPGNPKSPKPLAFARDMSRSGLVADGVSDYVHMFTANDLVLTHLGKSEREFFERFGVVSGSATEFYEPFGGEMAKDIFVVATFNDHNETASEDGESKHNRPKAFHPILLMVQLRGMPISLCMQRYGRGSQKFQGRKKLSSKKLCPQASTVAASRNFPDRSAERAYFRTRGAAGDR